MLPGKSKKIKFLTPAQRAKVAAIASVEPKKKETITWVPGTAAIVTSTVEISISCRNLPNKDLLSKSDPMTAVFYRPPGSRKWVPAMRTETIEDDLDPDFVAKLIMEYRFEQVQQLRFEVYDIDSDISDKLDSQDILGFVDTSLGQIVGGGENGIELELATVKSLLPIDQNKGSAKIILSAEETAPAKEEVTLKLGGINCGTWFFILPPKMYFAIYKFSDSGKYIIVYRSKQARGTSPNWAPMRISVSALCKGDYDKELRIDIFQKKSRVGFVLIGSALTTLNKLLVTNSDKIQLMSPTGQATTSYIRVISCCTSPIQTFVDYLLNGMRIHCCYAIDYTCSNGDPTDLQSLHFVSVANPNVYEQAMQAVGNILMNYDTLNLFPAFGFGARIPPKGEISYDFPLTLDPKNSNCFSLPGVLEAYRRCLRECQLYGPTNFAPVIKRVSKMASTSRHGQDYYILVIITDGVITDLALTKKAIVEASVLPLSIIIIGVGEADFDAMEELDGDAVPITHRRKKAVRDIVQFVSYRSSRNWMSSTGEPTELELEFPHSSKEGEEGAESVALPIDPLDPDLPPPVPLTAAEIAAAEEAAEHEERQERNKTTPEQLAQSQLAQEILAEIPGQILGFMRMKKYTPESVKQAFLRDIEAEKKRKKRERYLGGEIKEPLPGEEDKSSSSSESEDEEEKEKAKKEKEERERAYAEADDEEQEEPEQEKQTDSDNLVNIFKLPQAKPMGMAAAFATKRPLV